MRAAFLWRCIEDGQREGGARTIAFDRKRCCVIIAGKEGII